MLLWSAKEKKTYYELCTSMWNLLLAAAADFISQVEFTFSIVTKLYKTANTVQNHKNQKKRSGKALW